jgi:carbon monoxide dehydrogenase subunit G
LQLEHSFEVPVPVDDAWAILLDVERVAPCMPGATLETVHGDEFTGKVKVKVGPIQVTYGGRASFVDRDDAAHSVTIDASGKEMRGAGTAKATVRASMTSAGADRTRVDVVTDLNVTGRPAQFGRGVMVDVGNKIIGQFANCLEELIQSSPEPVGAAAGADAGGDATLFGADTVAEAVDAPAAVGSPSAETTTVAAAVDAPAAEGATAGASSPVTRAGSADAGASAAAVNAVGAAAGAAAAPGASSTGGAVGGTAAADVSALAGTSSTPSPASGTTGATSGPRRVTPTPPRTEAIDLLDAAGAPVIKRLAPLAAVLALLLLIWRLVRRRS